jgi:ankyrin repeat protein
MPNCSRYSSWARISVFVLALAATGGLLDAAVDLRLIQAIKARDAVAVRALLKQHIDVNAPQGDGATALHWAVRLDDVAIADILIRAGARANVANDLGATPIHLACLNRSTPMVDRLLNAGGDANAAMLNGESVLMTCARSGSAKAVQSLLAKGARVNVKEAGHNQTPLMWAAAQGHSDVVGLLIDAGADLRARSKIYPQIVAPFDTQRAGREELNYTVLAGGMTALFFAARAGDVESARLLVAGGAEVNDRLPDGTSVLVFAAYCGRTDVGALLLDKGADPNDMGIGYSALHAAILKSDVALVKALLARGANPNLRMTRSTPKRRDSEDFFLQPGVVGSTPYLLAAKFLEPEILSALRDSGADVGLSMPNGATALMLAAGMDSIATSTRRGVRVVDFGKVEPESRALEAVKMVLSFGGDMNAANQVGDTALHSAASLGYNTIIQLLVDGGAHVNAKNKRGLTPLGALMSAGRGRGRGAAAVDANGDDAPGGPSATTIALLRTLGGTQ